MFNIFADLISFHLQSIHIIERSNLVVKDLNRQLTESKDENRQYQYISNHNLQEPLRKIRIFSDMLVKSTENRDVEKARDLAFKINSSAQKFSMMIRDLSEFSDLNNEFVFETVDLNKVVADVRKQLNQELKAKNAVVETDSLPFINAIPLQMEQLFYHLINNAIRFSKKM
ncbi:hypothetical protein [Dyadobacter sp. NIV53]|uniref:sensor histidine kinase n=1 Tax=Dyadobacter sp. NIV53 TaxID=2861765 RepID=UPI001E2F71CE|nr:hypothetical protein [Dyadobacter sp. NIV53]